MIVTIDRIVMARRRANYDGSSNFDNPVKVQSPFRSIPTVAVTLIFIIGLFSAKSVRCFSQYPSFPLNDKFAERVLSVQSRTKEQNSLNTKLYTSAGDDFGSIDTNKDDAKTKIISAALGRTDDGYDDLGEYDPSENLPEGERDIPNVGDPQLRMKEKDWSVSSILAELAAIQQQGPQKYCILGTRHCSYLHQQIIELLAYALVLSGNHVYTSGAPGTNAATVRGALRAERNDLLTVVIPQSLEKQTKESQELLEKVDDLISMPQNDDMSLDVASRICNSHLLSLTDQLISFAFHESTTVIEASKEAKELDMLVTTLYLD